MGLDEQFERDVGELLKTEAGMRAIARIVMFCRVFLPSYDPVEANAENAVFREGMRNAGLMIWHAVRANCGEERVMRAAEQLVTEGKREDDADG